MDINNFDWGWMENPEVTDLKPLLIKEVFEDRIYEKFFTIDEGDIVLDIGSSVGPFAYSILGKKPKHVYCLEPSSVEFSTLNKNLRGYPVTPINKGIGEHNNGFYSDMVFGEFGNEKTFIESINFSTLLYSRLTVAFCAEVNKDKSEFLNFVNAIVCFLLISNFFENPSTNCLLYRRSAFLLFLCLVYSFLYSSSSVPNILPILYM